MSESASGEATSSSDATNKEFSCPSCDQSFDTEYGVKQHHAKTHDEKLRATVECSWCGNELERIPAEAERNENHFCNTHECKAMYQSEPYSGEGNPNYKGGEVSCTWCDDDLDRDMNQIERSDHFFCGGKDCKAKWQSKHVRGEDHPRWMGGYDGYYGPNWPEERLQAVIRDQARCQTCGATPMTCTDTLLVHHLIPMRVFKQEYDGQEIYDRANRLDNLLVLCKVCHMTWEGIPLRPQ